MWQPRSLSMSNRQSLIVTVIGQEKAAKDPPTVSVIDVSYLNELNKDRYNFK